MVSAPSTPKGDSANSRLKPRRACSPISGLPVRVSATGSSAATHRMPEITNSAAPAGSPRFSSRGPVANAPFKTMM